MAAAADMRELAQASRRTAHTEVPATRAIVIIVAVALALGVPSTAAAASGALTWARSGTGGTVALPAPVGADQRFIRVVDMQGTGLEVRVMRQPDGRLTTRLRLIEVTRTGEVASTGPEIDVTSRLGRQVPMVRGRGGSSILAIRGPNGMLVTTAGIEVTLTTLTISVEGLRTTGAFRSWAGYTAGAGSAHYVADMAGADPRASRAPR